MELTDLINLAGYGAGIVVAANAGAYIASKRLGLKSYSQYAEQPEELQTIKDYVQVLHSCQEKNLLYKIFMKPGTDYAIKRLENKIGELDEKN